MTKPHRQRYGLGRFIKKFTKPIKKVLKSPLAKAALLGGGLYGLNKWGPLAGKLGTGAAGLWSGFRGLKGGQQAMLGLGLLGVGMPYWQKMMKTGPYKEVEEETEDWTIPSTNLANLLTRTKDYYRDYDPYTSSLSFQPPKWAVNPTFYSAKGGRAGYQRGRGPAGGASAGGDYGGNVNPQQEYAGRTFQETYGGGNNITGGNTIRSQDMLPPPNLTQPSTVDRHRKLLTQNLYHKEDDEFDNKMSNYIGNQADKA